MAIKFYKLRQFKQIPAISRPKAVYSRHRYSTPLFVLKEAAYAFLTHNGLGLSASLSFYAMFALIPMALLLFFILSHLVVSSDYAIVKLAIVTSNLVPKLSSAIMVEVYNVSQHTAVWGVFGVLALFWIATPLAASLRNAFHIISAIVESPSFLRRKLKDVLAVMGILMMIFLFTFSGLVTDKLISFLNPDAAYVDWIHTCSSFIIITLLICVFYRLFFPTKVSPQYLFIGAMVTSVLWMAMRPAFSWFLSANESYGSMFGNMKNLFISIGWLYYTFAIFLVGTVVISTLRKKDILLLRPLFTEMPADKSRYLHELMARFGRIYYQNDKVFEIGNAGEALYYLVSGQAKLTDGRGKILRKLNPDDYFGEMSILTKSPRTLNAIVTSRVAEVVIIDANSIETLLEGEPKIAIRFLKQLAGRLQESHIESESSP